MENRRPVASRKQNVFHKIAFFLVKIGLTPNQVSVLSVVFAGLGSYGILQISLGKVGLGVTLGLVGIQLRLICNLLDGLMAVEGGLSTPAGELFNDVPDRFADWFLIGSCGFVASQTIEAGAALAWTAVVLSVMTAYVRVLGASMNAGHDFRGPMAKQHRMAVLNLALIATLFEPTLGFVHGSAVVLALTLIAIGAAVTVVRRLLGIYGKLK